MTGSQALELAHAALHYARQDERRKAARKVWMRERGGDGAEVARAAYDAEAKWAAGAKRTMLAITRRIIRSAG